MEGVTGAMWVGMQSLEHAFKNNQRLEIKSRQWSTAQHISSLIHRPAAAQSVIEQNTLPTSTAQQITGFSSRAKTAQQATPAPRRVSLKNQSISAFPRSAVPARTKQNSLWVSNLSNCNRITETRLHQKSHCANNSETFWPSGQNFSKLTFR